MAFFAPLSRAGEGPVVKICGLRSAEHAVIAAEAGAALLGLIFAASKRQVDPSQAAEIYAGLRRAGYRTPLVGVFVNEDPTTIERIAEQAGLAAVQLSGDEPPALFSALSLPVIVTLRLRRDEREHGWLELARRLPQRVLPHIDAHVPGAYGGTGVVADWAGAAALAREVPLLLSGGLSPDNVAEASAAVRPLGLDVSSGVETGGSKDPEKIRSFLRAARHASAER